jgi:type II secretory pathway component GspD/PulD (secretin)
MKTSLPMTLQRFGVPTAWDRCLMFAGLVAVWTVPLLIPAFATAQETASPAPEASAPAEPAATSNASSSAAEPTPSADAPSADEAADNATSPAADPSPSESATGAAIEVPTEADRGSNALRFSFSNTPWREVLNWLADGADVALHINELPTGSFTYSDPRSFTPNEAIEQLNLFLIPQGYTIVRRGSLLSVISLGDPRSMQQLDAMAELVSVDEIGDRGEYDVVKCIIPLGEISPSEATAELSTLTLMSEPAVLPNSNQLLVTDTVGKIRTVLAILRTLEEPESDEPTVQRLQLEHTDLENLLLAVGPHLGLEPNQRAGLDISISADAKGKQLFVSGTEEKVKLLENLITMVDVPPAGEDRVSQAILRSHPVSGENLQTVYDVLQTLLANQSIRLSMEPKTNSIVALADPSIHEEIVQTIEELQAPAVDFAVVSLNKVDPYFAITLLNEMFNIPSEYEEDAEDSNAPKLDADPENRRLFVRGTTAQIEQVKQVISSLDGGTQRSEQTRIVPLRGKRAQQVLEAAQEFWKGENRLRVLPPAGNLSNDVIERALHPEEEESDESQGSPVLDGERSAREPEAGEKDLQKALRQSPITAAQLTSTTADETADPAEASSPSDAPLIRSQLMPQGIVIQSDDPQALDQFEDYLEQLSGGSGPLVSQPVVFLLK